MIVGVCRLCKQERELQDSHFMAAGLYKVIRGPEPQEHPVLIADGASIQTSVQARGDMLCAECERRFDKGGEEWVIENCWHSEEEFPLRTALMTATPFVDEPGFLAYEARNVAGVDFDRFVYFAASVFWRATLDGWRFGKNRPDRLTLGPYAEQLRLFLLGDAEFPEHVILLITLRLKLDTLHNRTLTLPYGGNRTEGASHYECLVPGVTLQMVVGKGMPAEYRQTSTMPSGFLYIAEESDARTLARMVLASKNAPRRGKWAASRKFPPL